MCVRARACVCVTYRPWNSVFLVAGSPTLCCVMCMSNRIRKPPVHVGGKRHCTHRYVQQTLFNMVCMQNIHLANQAKTQRWSHCNQRSNAERTSCFYIIIHGACLSFPRTLMLTSIYFLEIHLHTVVYLNLNLNHAFIIKMKTYQQRWVTTMWLH